MNERGGLNQECTKVPIVEMQEALKAEIINVLRCI